MAYSEKVMAATFAARARNQDDILWATSRDSVLEVEPRARNQDDIFWAWRHQDDTFLVRVISAKTNQMDAIEDALSADTPIKFSGAPPSDVTSSHVTAVFMDSRYGPLGTSLYGSGDDSKDKPSKDKERCFYDEAPFIVARESKASNSLTQRHLQIGSNRAAHFLECMEMIRHDEMHMEIKSQEEGIVCPTNWMDTREPPINHHVH